MDHASIKAQLVALRDGDQNGVLKAHVGALLVECGYAAQPVASLVAIGDARHEMVYYQRPGWPEWYFATAEEELPETYTRSIASVMLEILKAEGRI